MSNLRLVGVAACLLAAALVTPSAQTTQSAPPAKPPAASPPAGQDPVQQPTFRARVDSISVDVQVTDKAGKPVTDLTEKDFEIRENNKPQVIDTFKLIKLDDSPIDPDSLPAILSFEDQRLALSHEDARLIVIFLDDYHVMRANSMFMREKLAKFVSQLNPRDLVAVTYPLIPVSALTFSRNHDAVARDIMAFEGRKYDYQPRNGLEQDQAMQPPEVIEQMRNSITINAVETLCAYMGSLREGRKTLLFTSEGLTGSTPSSVLGGAGGVGNAAPVGGANLMAQFEDIFAEAARSNTAVYTLDPRGLAVSEFGSTRNVNPEDDHRLLNEAIDSLRVIADQTGGRAIVGTNDPMPMLQQMVRDSSAYYLLSYTSQEKYRDKRFHPISVRVARKDVDIRARKGYWAYSADEVEKMTAPPKIGPPKAVVAALEPLNDPKRGRAVRVWMGATKGDDGKGLVTLAWEAVQGSTVDLLAPVDHISVTATSITGDQLFAGPVARDALSPDAAGRVTFAAPPGTVSVKVVAESKTGQRLDSDDAEYDVPDFSSVGVFITTPVVYRARTARDIQHIKTASPPPVPAASREFLRAERLLIRFQAFGPGGTKPAITVRLLNQLGEPRADLPPPAAVDADSFDIDLGLGSLAAADYILEITASAGGAEKKSLIAFRITG